MSTTSGASELTFLAAVRACGGHSSRLCASAESADQGPPSHDTPRPAPHPTEQSCAPRTRKFYKIKHLARAPPLRSGARPTP
eukprot:2171729-Pyramimonas_sp.AAC.1